MNILHVISSPRAASYSHRLSNGIVAKLQTAHPGSTVQVRDLVTHPFPHLEEATIQSFQSPAEQRSAPQREATRHSDEVIAELLAADVIVIGAPLYNFGISSNLKAWIDHLVRAGVTFRYGANGPEGLVPNRKVYVAMASGGVYSDGFMKAYDFVSPYLQTVLGFIGLTDVTVARVEGTSNPALEPTALATALDGVHV
ncbi:FMN-dependent NADH-azoreductase [Hymenobacter coccineus]|uniref:FMN dependent NADH:quinone oxidoreductase n=1 Tax=Hymenobacter coccineus TaxID=1908235 RepID=A0A1G1TGM2_9BACT|nr:NAD(P)H-dependent oxidoreductase [Hymenobacter coccineus]OGX90026.1 FMN-dependent NADH-azoreductase [Hymenobacter coccineus]